MRASAVACHMVQRWSVGLRLSGPRTMRMSKETHHVVGVLGLDEGREGVDPGLHGLVVPAGLTRLV